MVRIIRLDHEEEGCIFSQANRIAIRDIGVLDLLRIHGDDVLLRKLFNTPSPIIPDDACVISGNFLITLYNDVVVCFPTNSCDCFIDLEGSTRKGAGEKFD